MQGVRRRAAANLTGPCRMTPGVQPTVLGDASGRYERTTAPRQAAPRDTPTSRPIFGRDRSENNGGGTSCSAFGWISPPHPVGSARIQQALAIIPCSPRQAISNLLSFNHALPDDPADSLSTGPQTAVACRRTTSATHAPNFHPTGADIARGGLSRLPASAARHGSHRRSRSRTLARRSLAPALAG
jgi:hypothetical protein